MPHRVILRNLKALNLRRAEVTLALVKEYKQDRVSHYTVKYVPINQSLERRLKGIITNKIDNSNNVEEYSFDCPEPEADPSLRR